jgi:hypothetical protein
MQRLLYHLREFAENSRHPDPAWKGGWNLEVIVDATGLLGSGESVDERQICHFALVCTRQSFLGPPLEIAFKDFPERDHNESHGGCSKRAKGSPRAPQRGQWQHLGLPKGNQWRPAGSQRSLWYPKGSSRAVYIHKKSRSATLLGAICGTLKRINLN